MRWPTSWRRSCPRPEKLVRPFRPRELRNRAAARGINYRPCENGLPTTTATARSSTATGRAGASTWNASASLLEAPRQPSQPQPAQQETTENLAAPTAALWTTCVRDAPRPGRHREVAHYSSGETVTLDNWYKIADGYVWGRYTGYSGATRHIAVGKATGKARGRRLSGEGG